MPRLEAMKASLVLSWFRSPNQQFLTGVSGVGRTSSDDPSRRSSPQLLIIRSGYPAVNVDQLEEKDGSRNVSGHPEQDGEEEKIEVEKGRQAPRVSFAKVNAGKLQSVVAEDAKSDGEISQSGDAEINDRAP